MKYYTPTLEEFHVGFEFQIMNIENARWGNCIFKDGESAKSFVKDEETRVKYLDEQDFIDLGFIKSETDSLGYIYFTKSSYTIAYYPPTIFIEIDNEESPFQKFIGTIKNKSELIKLLTQLGL